MNKIIALSAIFGASSVVLGAFGAHALKNVLELSYLEAYKTGVMYQMFHALALLAIGILFHTTPQFQKELKRVTLFWSLGILLFSGSLYTLTWLTQIHKLFGLLTPMGGLFFIGGWIQLFMIQKINPNKLKPQ
jgi:uncharacterized membrane protein YgdD (TMEM256/DUF423 family)